MYQFSPSFTSFEHLSEKEIPADAARAAAQNLQITARSRRWCSRNAPRAVVAAGGLKRVTVIFEVRYSRKTACRILREVATAPKPATRLGRLRPQIAGYRSDVASGKSYHAADAMNSHSAFSWASSTLQVCHPRRHSPNRKRRKLFGIQITVHRHTVEVNEAGDREMTERIIGRQLIVGKDRVDLVDLCLRAAASRLFSGS